MVDHYDLPSSLSTLTSTSLSTSTILILSLSLSRSLLLPLSFACLCTPSTKHVGPLFNAQGPLTLEGGVAKKNHLDVVRNHSLY